MEGGGGRGWEGAEVLALAGGLWEAGLGAEGESPECWAEALLGLLEEPPPLRLSPPPPSQGRLCRFRALLSLSLPAAHSWFLVRHLAPRPLRPWPH